MKNLKIMAKPLNKINIKKKMYVTIKILILIHCVYALLLLSLNSLNPRPVINYIVLHIKNINVNINTILARNYHYIKFVIIIINLAFSISVTAMAPPDFLSAAAEDLEPIAPNHFAVTVYNRASIVQLINRIDDIDDMGALHTILVAHKPAVDIYDVHCVFFSEVETADYSSASFGEKLFVFGLCSIGIIYFVYIIAPILGPLLVSQFIIPILASYRQLLFWHLADYNYATTQQCQLLLGAVHNSGLFARYGM